MASARRFGLDVTVLGWGHAWTGFNMRFGLLLDFLRALPPDELVCICDAYDVIFLEDAPTIEARYRALVAKSGAPIVVSHDNPKLFFAQRLYFYWYFGLCKDRRVNAGTWMGPAGALTTLIEEMRSEFERNPGGDDQMLLTKYCRCRSNLFTIDDGNDVFFVAAHAAGALLDLPTLRTSNNGKLWYRGKRQCIVHAAGGGDLVPLLRKLGYHVTPQQREALRKYHNTYRAASLRQHTSGVLHLLCSVFSIAGMVAFALWALCGRVGGRVGE
jgi:hypothetical protein